MEPADLLGHRAVIYTRDGGGGEEWKFRKETAEVSVKVQGQVKITATEGVRAAVLADMGLAIVSEWAFTPELKSGKVMSVMDDWLLPSINLSAVYPTGRLASTKARQFAAFVETCLADEAA
jgi:DNA-binding transcriptional LysR family regulator